MENTATTQRIHILVFHRCQIVDATGAAGVFGSANEAAVKAGRAKRPYDIKFIAPETNRVKTSAGVSLYADYILGDRIPPADTLICPGGKGAPSFISNPKAIKSIKHIASRTRRVVSVCTGAFILAEAGILDGRRAATHWAYCDQLSHDYRAIKVEADPIFVKDGNVYTSAGVTAGMDLALALIEEDIGRDIALEVARDMVMFSKRPGSQAQFSTQPATQMAPPGNIRDLQLWLLDNLSKDIDVDALAEKSSMSLRTFYRKFKKTTGLTPARFINQSRLDAARRLIKESPIQIKSIAAQCGFGDIERMRRAFQKDLGISPDDYRRRFASSLNE